MRDGGAEGQPDFVALCDRMLLRSDLRVLSVRLRSSSIRSSRARREAVFERRRLDRCRVS
jgi:hypothetical protein